MADLGHDLYGVSDLTSDMQEVSGRNGLAQSIARRLSTPRGRLIDDPDYGFSLPDFLNDDIAQDDLARIVGGIQAECLKDERVYSAQASFSSPDNSGVYISVIQLVDGAGPFKLVLSVGDVTVDILRVTT